MAHIEPLFELQPEGGQVIVTRFECRSRLQLAFMVALHIRVKRAVRIQARGLIASKALVDWRRRTLLSISLWNDLDSIYSMGSVTRHIEATRIARRIGVRTACGVFCFAGDWKRVMFRAGDDHDSPLRPLEDKVHASAAS
jgi:hypothetical protein